MSSDDTYSNFLDKANQDTRASKPSAQSKSADTKLVDTEVPMTLKGVEQYYTSEADEPFEPVSLKWDGKNMPSESTLSHVRPRLRQPTNDCWFTRDSDEFKDLVGHCSNVSTLSLHEFDPNSDYKEVLQAVEKAGDGKARIFRLEQGRSRAEYYVVGYDQKGKRVVGLKAKAVES